MYYFDYAANYPVKKEVLDELCKVETDFFGNANSLHTLGQKAKLAYDIYDSKIKNILKLDDNYEIIYCSSASEANNLAIKGLVKSYSGFGKHILVSEYEHSSINGCLGYLKTEGFDIEFIPTKSDGKIDIESLKKQIRKDTILVCIILVEGETGVIQDYQELSKIVSEHQNCHLLMDATQGIGKIQFDLNKIELVTFTPHKFGGLTGTGCLIKRKSTVLTPLIHGGKSASIYRSGTIPLGLIASTYKALEIAYSKIDENYTYVKSLYDYFIDNIKRIQGIKNNSLGSPYIINLSITEYRGSYSVSCLNQLGICVSQKSACSIVNTPSKSIMSIFKDKQRALSSFRISICEKTTMDEINYLLEKIRGYKSWKDMKK